MLGIIDLHMLTLGLHEVGVPLNKQALGTGIKSYGWRVFAEVVSRSNGHLIKSIGELKEGSNGITLGSVWGAIHVFKFCTIRPDGHLEALQSPVLLGQVRLVYSISDQGVWDHAPDFVPVGKTSNRGMASERAARIAVTERQNQKGVYR